MGAASPIEAIESLLRAQTKGALAPHWRTQTAVALGLDSLAMVDLQLELETLFDVDLGDDVTLGLGNPTMQALAARIDGLRHKAG